MAEALGIASGIIAVLDMTFKVGGAGIKLRRRIHDVKEAREMLLDKLGQVQDIEEFLHHAESQIATNPLPRAAWSDPFLQRCIFRARAVLLELQQMIDRLLDEATVGGKCKRTLGSAKAVLQKDGIEALDARLMRALELFKLAQAQYTIYKSKRRQQLTPDSFNNQL
ncbi:hypothetical protein K4K59_010440 [Colletotrichum sp. SAR11_240]|nr:hypothetical protein K4K59_010440 [Colletotrichum sp. SAR11_240]